MGEKLYVISKVNIKGMNFDIELNDGSAASKRPLHIHLQNERFRIDVPDYEYLRMALALRKAGKTIRNIKDLNENGEQ